MELPPDTGARPFSWWYLVSGALAGACGASLGALGVGVSYLMANGQEEIPWETLAPSFLVYMISAGALAGLVVRGSVLVSARHPVLSAASFGAFAGLAPGGFAAREFGSLPLPFVGSTGIVLGALPLFLVVSVMATRDEGRAVLRPALIALLVVSTVFGVLAVAGSTVHSLSLLEVLRAFLFLGLERLGAALGAAIGLLLGLVAGLTVIIDRALQRQRIRAV